MLKSLDHHAYGIAGDAEAVIPELMETLESLRYRTHGNPDFRFETHELMGIDEARTLKEAAERTAVSGGKKVFVISARGLTREAQNALLKVFEEPPKDTHFFLVVPSFEAVLQTLRSRLYSLTPDSGPAKNDSPLASEFLADTVQKRLKTIQGLLKEAEDESGKQKLAAFLDALECSLASRDRSASRGALTEVLEAKKYSRDRAPSFKLLLEHLALVLPQMK